VERAAKDQVERVINHTVRDRFTAGAVQRAVLPEHGSRPRPVTRWPGWNPPLSRDLLAAGRGHRALRA
jgi:hypothetical protein